MTPLFDLRFAGALMLSAVLALPGITMADPSSQCGNIAKDVQASITKDPAKILMIVEDALVINESCACEIIKAAIAASHADAAAVKQIVQTAVAVAPKMSPVIIECAGSAAPDAKVEVASKAKDNGKNAKNVLPEPVVPPKDTGSDYSSGGSDIRGIYLMQPAVGGTGVTTQPVPPEDDDEDKPHHRKHHRQRVVTPLSPSCSCPDTPDTPDMPGWTP